MMLPNKFQMSKEDAIDYVKRNYHDSQMQLSPIEGYLFKDDFFYELFAETERGGGPLYGEIIDNEFYLIGYNSETIKALDLDPKLEGALFSNIIEQMNELIKAIPVDQIPDLKNSEEF